MSGNASNIALLRHLANLLVPIINNSALKKGWVRHVVERFIKGGNTVNLCAIDLSKAFDKVNHHALLMKLMKRNLPVVLIDILENWLKNCSSMVK